MKILAFYLPQFHEIAENNDWWGKGFTDWTNVKKAKPLFDGHYQPLEPLNDNYYDLDDIEVMKWQSKIAQDHGVYGFCYYHYWFNGKLLLEKPLENMLNDVDVTIPFCLSWANEPWARTWDGQNSNVLMSQEYGNEKEWRKHFDYLLLFFKDKRYIKEGNKPMMIIYKTMHIPRVDEMCEYWDELAKENGFDGLYIVETLGGVQNKPFLDISKAAIEFEPNLTMNSVDKSIFSRIIRKINKINFNGLTIFNYDEIWERVFKRDPLRYKDKKLFLGGFVGWDNTARKGSKGTVFKGSNPYKFELYIKKQIERSTGRYLFINAWNEWAEGTYMEPDKRYNFSFLEAIKNVIK